jgi:hypothetical protein
MNFIVAKKVRQKMFPPSSFLLLDPGSEIGNPGWKKTGSGINIPDGRNTGADLLLQYSEPY